MNRKIVLGFSGGIDSTYTAVTLKEKGYEVFGVFLLMHSSAESSVIKAKQAAEKAAVSLEIVDARQPFKKYVVDRFIHDYMNGRTPNPCVECNRFVKIDLLCRYAKEHGIEFVSTGHYARVMQNERERYSVYKALDSRKDQSYMLWQLTQEQLSMLVTPLSVVLKDGIIAEASSLTGQSSYKESQDICFIPDGDRIGFIKKNSDALSEKGFFIDKDGNILGEHQGLYHYTIGQRKRLGIALGERAFITKIDPASNNITIGFGEETQTDSFTVSGLNEVGLMENGKYEVCIRYRAKPAQCTLTISGNKAYVTCEDKLRAVTSGQSAVFYRGDELCFGGIID